MSSTPRMTIEDWTRAAYEAMLEGGLNAIAVESLARKLDVTKGSFYWHFKNRDALLTSLLTLWEEQATQRIIEALNQIEDPGERLMELIRQAWDHMDHVRAEAIFQSAAARHDPLIAPFYTRVTRTRLAYTTSLYREMGHDESSAAHWGRTAYGAFLGTVQLVAVLPEAMPDQATLDAYVAHLSQVLLPLQGLNVRSVV